MKAKPIIDIDVELENWNDFEKARNELAKIGYEHEGNKEITERAAFGRSGTEHNEILVTIDHYLYVCSVDNEEYNRHILFRDYLRDRPYVYNLTMKIERYISDKDGIPESDKKFIKEEAKISICGSDCPKCYCFE